jgi:ribosomal protein S18 acetylase RimI-like enzyme/predicted nucleic acid-binding protein
MDHSDITDDHSSESLRILTLAPDVQPFVDAVRAAADEHTKALGFLPASVYGEFARKQQLFVATTSTHGGRGTYAAHLLFDPRFPRAQILQLYCKKEFRKRGIAKHLLSALVTRLTNEGLLSVQARVAEDLAANSFWESQCFYVQRTVTGRGQKPRRINVRVLELDTPQLFDRSPLASGSGNPLGLSSTSIPDVPLYLVDLNVLFDLAIQRVRHDLAADLFRSVHAGHCRLGVSDEAEAELKRTARRGVSDPMLELVSTLPQYRTPVSDEGEVVTHRLAALVFPDRHRLGTLTPNDHSDIAHLRTAIHHGLSGFITSDDAVLRAAPEIEAQFGLRILSPEAFQGSTLDEAVSHSVAIPLDRQLEIRPATDFDGVAIREMLARQGLGAAAISSSWMSPLRTVSSGAKFCVSLEGQLAGYIIWSGDIPGSKQTIASVVVDERHLEAPAVARCLLRHLLNSVSASGPRELLLELAPRQSELRDFARQYGFHSVGAGNSLKKISAGRVLSPSTWLSGRDAILTSCNLKLPIEPPTYSGSARMIEVVSPDGYRRHVALDALETYLSPVLLCLPRRPAVMVPIERRFAEPLLGHSPQSSLLPASTVSLFSERHYICGPNAIRLFDRGHLILFYESGSGNGHKAVVAIGRITEAFLKRRDDVDASTLERSVLTTESLENLGASSVKSIAAVDNIFPLRSPVPLSFLRSIGLGDPNQLITAYPVSEQQLRAILGEGFKNA